MCGDNYADVRPRAHEFGGQYGQGNIVKSYWAGSELPVRVQLTANHLGYFYFQICNLDQNGRVETDACFEQNRILLVNGGDTFRVPHPNAGWFDVTLRLPDNLRCNHCVLQWTYVTGEHLVNFL